MKQRCRLEEVVKTTLQEDLEKLALAIIKGEFMVTDYTRTMHWDGETIHDVDIRFENMDLNLEIKRGGGICYG